MGETSVNAIVRQALYEGWEASVLVMHPPVGRCRLTPGWKQLTPRLLSGTFREFQRLKVKYDKPLSSFAFKCNLRHYALEAMRCESPACRKPRATRICPRCLRGRVLQLEPRCRLNPACFQGLSGTFRA